MPEGGMYSTAADMAAFYQMMINGGSYNGQRILAKSTVEVMTALHTGDFTAGACPVWGMVWPGRWFVRRMEGYR